MPLIFAKMQTQTKIEKITEQILFHQHSLNEIKQKKEMLLNCQKYPSEYFFCGDIFIKGNTENNVKFEMEKLQQLQVKIQQELTILIPMIPSPNE
jgi:hypothetical protein